MTMTQARLPDGKFAMEAEDADLLSRVATSWSPNGADVHENFLAACRADARDHAGLISVNRVRALCAPMNVPPRKWSSLWTHYTGTGRPMEKTRRIDEFAGAPSRNNGKPYFLRRWRG